MGSAQNTVVVDLGPLRHVVEERVKSGAYSSPDEVIQAGLHALERQETILNEWLTKQAEQSLADPEPSIPAAEVFRELRAIHPKGCAEAARNRATGEANERFLKGGIRIRDAFGSLAE